MTPDERLIKIERVLQTAGQDIEKQNEAIRGLIVVARTCLDSFGEMRERHDADYKRLRESQEAAYQRLIEAQAATDEKLNILIDTVDRIIRREDHP